MPDSSRHDQSHLVGGAAGWFLFNSPNFNSPNAIPNPNPNPIPNPIPNPDPNHNPIPNPNPNTISNPKPNPIIGIRRIEIRRIERTPAG